MKPLLLQGHERSVTCIKYNRQGDLLFSVAKDTKPTVWYSDNGERLGTYNGHGGAVWCVDVNRDSHLVLTGSADSSAILWDCELGKPLRTYVCQSAVRTCGFNVLGNQLLYTTDETMGQKCQLFLYDTASSEDEGMHLDIEGSKITSAQWGPFDEHIITGHENGEVRLYDVRQLTKPCKMIHPHKGSINNLQMSIDRTFFVTASKDHAAKLFESDTLQILKTYFTERPINSAAISPIREHVVLGGGQEAAEVTTTATKAGKFYARFFHLIFEEEIGRVKGHFGPINSVEFHPNGKSYSSGGEDGFVRVHNFDDSYFSFDFDY